MIAMAETPTARESISKLSALVARRNQTATDALKAAGAARQAEEDLQAYLVEVQKTIPAAARRETRPVKEPDALFRSGKRVRFIGDRPDGIRAMEPSSPARAVYCPNG